MESSIEAMEKRHETEQAQLLITTKAMMKSAKKSEKTVVEARCIQMQYDLKANQSAEIDDLLERIGNGTVVQEATAVEEELINETDLSSNKVESKRAKAQRKKERKSDKDSAKAAQKQEQLANAGPSKRDIELSQLNAQLIPLNLHVKEILSDGHCLYRAVSDQIQLRQAAGHLLTLGALGAEETGAFSSIVTASTAAAAPNFASLRKIAAVYMRANPSDFAPFMGFEESSQEFNDYCSVVEDISKAEWGGQLEIRALCGALKLRMNIFEANMPKVVMGEESCSEDSGDANTLNLSFHRHYFALGEHYNSVIPL